MFKRFTLYMFMVIFSGVLSAQDIQIAKKTISYLASDKLEGRFPGTAGDSMAQQFIESEIDACDLNPFDFGYRQEFEIVTDIAVSNASFATWNGEKLVLKEDYMPMSFSGDDALNASVIFYGQQGDDEKPDYQNKWVLKVIDNKNNPLPRYDELMKLYMDLKTNNAGGLILTYTTGVTDSTEFYPFIYTRSFMSADIPVIQISSEIINKSLKKYDVSISDLNTIKSDDNVTYPEIKLHAQLKIDKIKTKTANLAGWIEGSDTNTWIVLGAHHDHLGYGGYGSGSRAPEQYAIHNGADDNASGVATVLMLADYYAEHKPDLNLAFVLFGAEEQGLLGSKYFVENMPFEKEKIKNMLNFDMVGRVKDSVMDIIGTTTAKEYQDILTSFDDVPLTLKLRKGGYSGSDQAMFYAEKIPVLFFFAGINDDYHTPADDIDLINFQGIKMLADYCVVLLDTLLLPETLLTYQEVEESGKSRHGSNMKVKFGIMPDMTGESGDGMRIDAVMKGGVAYKTGLQKKDIIIKIGDNDIGNIYDYMKAMSGFNKEDKTQITVIRDGKTMVFDVEF
ncbi:MAG: M20/M25/M40 family metallo-hydrolase [Bacteroidota bacterium]|nr:M20/M25/M40 family metallo-hydrolase [Bacteroidota bacterium]